jgi:hypothetical protein
MWMSGLLITRLLQSDAAIVSHVCVCSMAPMPAGAVLDSVCHSALANAGCVLALFPCWSTEVDQAIDALPWTVARKLTPPSGWLDHWPRGLASLPERRLSRR